MKKKRETRDALRDFRDKNDGTIRIQYWKRRKLYEKILQYKRNIWQKKEAEEINKLAKRKEINKLRQAIRKLVRKKDFGREVKSQNLVKYFNSLSPADNKVGLLNDTQMLGPQYREKN
jgi:hypothetical protein